MNTSTDSIIVRKNSTALLTDLLLSNDVLGFFAAKFPLEIIPANDPAVAYTDFKSVFMSAKLEKTPHKVGFIYAHELLHIFMQHKSREGARDHRLWNIATDYEINETILFQHYKEKEWVRAMKDHKMEMISYDSLKESVDGLEKGMAAEQVYPLLVTAQEENQLSVSGSGQSEADSNNDSSNGRGQKVTVRTASGNEITIEADVKKGGKGDEEEKAAKAAESLIHQATSQSKMAGSESSEILDRILKKAQISDRILEKVRKVLTSIDSGIGKHRGYRTYSRVNKIIPSMPGTFKAKKCLNELILTIDESGSMSDEDIAKIVYGVYDIVNRRLIHIKHVVLIRHDVGIIVDEDVKNFSSYTRKKSGGTSHEYVYAWIKDHQAATKADSTCIFITDGFSDIQDLDWGKIRGGKIWILTEKTMLEGLSNVDNIGSVIEA